MNKIKAYLPLARHIHVYATLVPYPRHLVSRPAPNQCPPCAQVMGAGTLLYVATVGVALRGETTAHFVVVPPPSPHHHTPTKIVRG